MGHDIGVDLPMNLWAKMERKPPEMRCYDGQIYPNSQTGPLGFQVKFAALALQVESQFESVNPSGECGHPLLQEATLSHCLNKQLCTVRVAKMWPKCLYPLNPLNPLLLAKWKCMRSAGKSAYISYVQTYRYCVRPKTRAQICY